MLLFLLFVPLNRRRRGAGTGACSRHYRGISGQKQAASRRAIPSIELFHYAREAGWIEGNPVGGPFPRPQRSPTQCGPMVPVNDAEREPLFKFECLYERAGSVEGVVGRVDTVDPLREPLVRIDVVIGDAGLEDVEQRKARVVDCLFHYLLQVFLITRVASRHETAIERDRKGKGKIVIEYTSVDDYERVVGMLRGRA